MSLTFDQKFEIFKAKVNALFDLPEEAWSGMKDALIESHFNVVETKTVVTQSSSCITTTTGEAKYLNGYNVYIKDNMKSGKDFKTCGEDWKALSEDQKAAYNTKAKEANELSGAKSKSKGSKTSSGWNIYVKENSKSVKAANPGLNSHEVMKKLGTDWKALTKEGQSVWNEKAKALST